MNLVHLAGCDGTDPDSMTKNEIEGRRRVTLAIEALRRYTPGCANARLRNFGMTIGIRDTRKIDARYNLTEHDVRNEARFEDTIGIYPEFIDGYGVLVLPTTGRYMHVPYRSMLPRSSPRDCWSRAGPSAATESLTRRRGTWPAAPSPARAPASPPRVRSAPAVSSMMSTSPRSTQSSIARACGTDERPERTGVCPTQTIETD